MPRSITTGEQPTRALGQYDRALRDYDQAYKVLDGPIGEGLLKTVERSGLKGLGSLEIGFRNLTNSKRPVRVPQDVKGLKIRTTPNPAHLQAFRLLGANPVGMPFTEVYLALKTGDEVRLIIKAVHVLPVKG
jgi:TRAP-type C4-dicarboxylate transport system substrate-binding protein